MELNPISIQKRLLTMQQRFSRVLLNQKTRDLGPVLKGSIGTESGPVLPGLRPAKALCLIPEWIQEEDTYVGLSSILRKFIVNLVTCDYII